MKRVLVIIAIMMTVFASKVNAQWVGINVDYQTIAAITASFAANAAAEGIYNKPLKEILEHYKTAEFATAGILTSKYLDRRALTNLGIWSSRENYYYQRIYKMVSTRIIPKIWVVTQKMLKEPQQILYWGPYIYEVCKDTKDLCMEFETMVTNSTLSFADIPFPEMVPEIAELLDLTKIGDVDWNQMLDELVSIKDNFTLKNFQEDFTKVYKNGAELGAAGSENVAAYFVNFVQGDGFEGSLSEKVQATYNLVNKVAGVYNSAKNDLPQTIMGIVGVDVTKILDPSGYNVTGWLSEYLKNPANDNHYTQKWYIVYRNSTEQWIDSFDPDPDYLNSPHWVRITTGEAPTPSEKEQAFAIAEGNVIYSEEDIEFLNDNNSTGNVYEYGKTLHEKRFTQNGVECYAIAYSINIVRHTNFVREVVYEEVFNSYTDNLDTFMAGLNAKKDEYNNNTEGKIYVLESDNPVPYIPATEDKVAISKSATISVTCHEKVNMGEGATQYKCGDCDKNVTSHTKECSMYTSLPDDELDLSELENKLSQLQSEVTSLNDRILQLKSQNAGLGEDSPLYQQNIKEIASLQSEVETKEKQIQEARLALQEAETSEQVATDDYYRIPAIMNDCKLAYNLTWQGDGSWQGNTFVRTATMKEIDGIITFNATISIAKPPRYLLGFLGISFIKISRAVVQIEWDLSSEYTNNYIAEIVDLDPSLSDAENAKIVNERMAEVAETYPECIIDVEYEQVDPLMEDETEDTYHLLWSSERLEIARKVDTRIHIIYNDLVNFERFLNYKHSIIDVLKDMLPYVDVYRGRRYSVLENCRRHWLRNAATITDNKNYHGQWDEPLPDDREMNNN